MHHPRSSAVQLSLAAALVACLGLPLPAAGTIVSGQVTGPTGEPIEGVDLDFVDSRTGMVVPTPNDDTDLLGFYAVDVPEGRYDIQFEPPVGSRYVADEIARRDVAGPAATVDHQLEIGFEVLARILGPDLLPLESANLAVVDPGSGTRLFSHLDRSDSAGIVRPIVPPGTWQLTFSPPTGVRLIPVRLDDVTIDVDLDLGDVVLEQGYRMTGRVVGAGGPPLDGARLEAVDSTTGLPLDSARTDGAGTYELFVPAAVLRIDVSAAFGEPWSDRSVHGLLLRGDLQLPDIVLDREVVVSGLVVDEAMVPIETVDLDFDVAATGERVTTTGDDTGFDGRYEVIVPAETYDVGFDPPLGLGLVGEELDDVVLWDDTELPTVVLRAGVALSGRVLAPGGAPAEGVNVDVRDPVTGDGLELEGDRTDASGLFSTLVPLGTWNVFFRPPAGSGWGAAARDGEVVAGPRDLGDIQLPASVTPTVDSVDPVEGPEAGGTLVTVRGTGFERGVRVRFGGRLLRGVTVLGPDTLQGTTRASHRGLVDVEVENPGAAGITLTEGFRYVRAPPEPLLMVSRDGPVGTDVLLSWDEVNGPDWSIFRGAAADAIGPAERVDIVGRTWWRDEGGTLIPGLVVYVVH